MKFFSSLSLVSIVFIMITQAQVYAQDHIVKGAGGIGHVAAVNFQKPQCEKLNIEGKWNNHHGSTFKIIQKGCESATLIDLTNGAKYIFDFTGKTPTVVPESFLAQLSSKKSGSLLSDSLKTMKATFKLGSNGDIKAEMTGELPLEKYGFKGSYHTVKFFYSADIYVGLSGRSNDFDSVIPDVIDLYTESAVITSVDSASVNGQTDGFLMGANAILRMAKNFITAELFRVL